LPIAASIIVSSYVIGTFAVLLAMPSGEVNTLQGLIQAGAVASQRLGATWIIVPLALLITIGNLGAASGFLSCAARFPSVGVDRLLPPVFARVHAEWGTPYVAILLQGGLGAVLCVIWGSAGTGVEGAYDVLVSMGIIASFLPFALVFLAVIRLQGQPPGVKVTRLPGGRFTSTLFACIGLATTLAALVLAAFPASDEPNKLLAVIKEFWADHGAARQRDAGLCAWAAQRPARGLMASAGGAHPAAPRPPRFPAGATERFAGRDRELPCAASARAAPRARDLPPGRGQPWVTAALFPQSG